MARNPLTPFRSGFGLLGGDDPFLSPHREMNRLFDDVLRGTSLPSTGRQGEGGNVINAQMNVSETQNEIRITAELPGVSEQDIDINLEDDMLTIRGEKKFERKDEKENFHFVECSYGTFQRSVRLPFPMNPDQVQARFENGVLTVTVPKTGRPERSHRIQIQGRAAGGQVIEGTQAGQGTGSEASQAKQGGKPRKGGSEKTSGTAGN
ncbi:Hsp20/alpha crystallin family protein [Microvirga sp. VF16]|uniref:Hsp20/alpha crystallin family protein n=1 Tax=Microvirga sp. VF16 TaxID=2807101 RepID=UPI00193DD7FC|nr:Hsp20/alpha crystallin family protein [Microvirga sp. VF16]QRM36100.1 Hsp20/alpha crystallin family protein [Microvirga sp. VF16]